MTALEVARVARPHGLRGGLKLDLHWVGSSSLVGAERVELELPSGERRTYELESVGGAGKTVYVKLRGVEARESAEALRGARVLVDRGELPPLEAGEAYLVDLVGAEVFAPDGLVGEVVRVEVHPSVDSLVIRCPDGRIVEQVIVPAFVQRLAPELRRIELSSREALIDSSDRA